MNYKEIISLIEKNTDKVEFADFGDGVSQEWIESAESRLGVVFPPSYIWWLKNYSGGQINGNEIFSIYELDFDEVVGGDIVYINELNQKNGLTNKNQLTIQENDFGEMYYFDLSQRRDDGECPVFCDLNHVKFADSFLDFLSMKILEIH
jgi:antitoxin YobK